MKLLKKTYLAWHEYAARQREATLPTFISKTNQEFKELMGKGNSIIMLDQHTIGDLLSNQLMKLPMKISEVSKNKCIHCGG